MLLLCLYVILIWNTSHYVWNVKVYKELIHIKKVTLGWSNKVIKHWKPTLWPWVWECWFLSPVSLVHTCERDTGPRTFWPVLDGQAGTLLTLTLYGWVIFRSASRCLWADFLVNSVLTLWRVSRSRCTANYLAPYSTVSVLLIIWPPYPGVDVLVTFQPSIQVWLSRIFSHRCEQIFCSCCCSHFSPLSWCACATDVGPAPRCDWADSMAQYLGMGVLLNLLWNPLILSWN